jgi:hypothetical protein
MQLRSNLFGTFTHAGQSPMPFATRLDDIRGDPTAVIANQHAQAFRGVGKLDLNAGGVGVAKGIEQGLPANTIKFIPEKRMQRARLAIHYDAKIDFRLDGEFLLDG